ncbi:MAG: hypothetical protein QM534_06380 [Sediminibacterium sp.]|nr:hypothetical protein [Sediminibacterium sp.]
MNLSRNKIFISISVCMFLVTASLRAQSDMDYNALKAEVCATEMYFFMQQAAKTDTSFNCIPGEGNITEMITDFYTSKMVFRSCSLKAGILNGEYKLFYRNGVLLHRAFYQSYLPKDTSCFFYSDGSIRIKLIYPSNQDKYVVQYFHKNGKLKKEVVCKTPPSSSGYSNVYAAEKQKRALYFDITGKKISRKKFLSLYPESLIP